MERGFIDFYFDLITNLLEFFTYVKYCNYHFEFREEKKMYLRNYIIYVICLIIISSLSLPHIWLIMTACNFIFNRFTYQTNIIKNLKHIIRYNIFYFVPFFILFLLSMLIFDSKVTVTNEFYQYLKVVVICIILYILYSFVYSNKKSNDKRIVNPYKKFIYPLLCSILAILCTFIFISINLNTAKETIQNIILLTFLVNIMMIILIISVYEKIVAFLQESALEQLKLQKYEMNQNFYDELSEKTKQLSSLKHDFKNHLTIIHGWLGQRKYKEVDAYLGSIIDYVDSSSDVIITKNQTISSILQAKKAQCEKLGLKLEYELDFEEIYKISDMDLIILLGNILDNAIEAVEKIKDGRNISLSIQQAKTFLVISCKNPIFQKPIEKDGVLLTSKTDKGIHGMGLSNVIDTCKKYNGECTYNYDDTMFYIELLVPNY